VEKLATTLARKMGVPTYETIFVNDSQRIIPYDFMIMSCAIGRPIQEYSPLTKELEQKLVSETGKYATMIHKIKPLGFGFFDNRLAKTEQILQGQYGSFKEHIYAALDEDLKYLVDNKVLNPNQTKKIIKLFNKSEDLMNYKKGCLIHNDIADWNELTDGKKITGIMDWDECFSGDPLMELAAYSLFYGESRLSWFKEGYRQIGKLENNEDKFQLFKLRYLISKMHLRKKRSTIDPSPIMKQNIARGMQAIKEVFDYFKF
jgi:aminoglycoside phosphotransferase (APT) family kinase protein